MQEKIKNKYNYIKMLIWGIIILVISLIVILPMLKPKQELNNESTEIINLLSLSTRGNNTSSVYIFSGGSTGMYLSDGTLVNSCPVGTTLNSNRICICSDPTKVYDLENRTCQQFCSPGYVKYDNICVKCSPGTYSDQNSQTCKFCDPGSYSNIAGSSSCTLCPEETYAPTKGTIMCIPCANARIGSSTCL